MHSPCCTCGSCSISTDTFGGTLDPKWTVESGTWAISSGRLAATGAGLIYDATPNPDGVTGNTNVQVTYRFTAGSGDNILRVLVSYEDDSNYLYAEYGRPASGCPYLQLGKVVAGVDTPLGDPSPLDFTNINQDYIANVCYFGADNLLRAYLSTFTGVAGNEQTVTGTGDKAGFEVLAGNATFDSYSLNHAKTDSDRLLCSACAENCLILGKSLSGSINTCLFTEVSGSWGTDYVGTGDSILRCNRPHPTGKTNAYANLAYSGAGVGEKIRLYVNYLDASNNHFGEWEYLSTTSYAVRLYKKVGGADTLLEERIDTATGPFTLPRGGSFAVCFDGTRIGIGPGGTATAGSASAATTPIAGGVYAGIGTSGGVGFTSFEFDKHYSEESPAETSCPVCSKTCGCKATTLPLAGYVIDFGAGGWTDDFCGHCDTIAGEFTLGDVFDGDNPCEAAYYDLDVCAVDPGDCADCGAFMDFAIFLEIVTVSADVLKWKVTVRYLFIPDINPLCANPCDTGKTVVYESATFTSAECHEVPVTLTKISEIGTYPCGGALPNTITMDAA